VAGIDEHQSRHLAGILELIEAHVDAAIDAPPSRKEHFAGGLESCMKGRSPLCPSERLGWNRSSRARAS